MSFLAAEDFNLVPYNLPNLENVGDTFPDYLDEQEERALKKILGSLLYEKMAANLLLAADAQAQRFKDLRDGVVYTHNGIRYRWEGMVKTLRPYIYCLWLREGADSVTELGVVEANAENSKVVSPAARMSRAYNDFSSKIGNSSCFKDTLYGYLWNSGETYIEDIAEYEYTSIQSYLYDYFKNPGKVNQFGL